MTTTKTQIPAPNAAAPARSGFQPIPTRIRDPRDGVPPLVIAPADEAQKTALCETLGELGSRLADIHRTAGEAFLSQGLYEQALPHLEAAATFAPGELEYHNQLGFVRYVTGDDVGATQSFQRVLASDTQNADAWFNLGMVLAGQSRFGEAESCFQHAIEHGIDDAQVWNNRGVCCWQEKRNVDAKACFQQALARDPSDQDAMFNLASIG